MEVAERAFHETATTYGLAVAVLVFFVVGLLGILWKLGSRLIASHERFLDRQIESADKTATEIQAIKEKLPSVCQASCPDDQHPQNVRKRLA